MSLTTILNSSNKPYKEFQNFLNENFPLPKIKLRSSKFVSPKSNKYALIGTAYDYLLRFRIEKEYKNITIKHALVAEQALGTFSGRSVIFKENPSKLSNEELENVFQKEDIKNTKVREMFAIHFNHYNDYIKGNRLMSYDLLKASLFFARLDSVYRGGILLKRYVLDEDSDEDLSDLKELILNSRLKTFEAKDLIVLNPTFGKVSTLVGGADADLIIDNKLIDIKTTKHFKITRSIYNQIIGYYILYLIGKIDSISITHKIEKIGIYYSRFDYLWLIDVASIGTKETFEKAVEILKSIKTTVNMRS